jgi:hypothetical protein
MDLTREMQDFSKSLVAQSPLPAKPAEPSKSTISATVQWDKVVVAFLQCPKKKPILEISPDTKEKKSKPRKYEKNASLK